MSTDARARVSTNATQRPITVIPAAARPRRPKLRPYLMLLPAVALMVAVMVGPLIYSVVVSLYQTNYLKLGRFIGLANYLRFWHDGSAFVRNMLVFVFGSLVIVLPLSMLLALCLNRGLRFTRLFRTVLLLPWAVSQVVTALVWVWLLDTDHSPLNWALTQLTGAPVNFLGAPAPAMIALVLASVWQSFGYPTLLNLAALQTVPGEVMEAARIDGCGRWRMFTAITLPLIKHSVLVAVLMMSIHYVNMVTIPLVLTGGGPAGATEVVSLAVYREAFEFNRYGYASAIAIYMLLFNVVFSLLYIRLTGTRSE